MAEDLNKGFFFIGCAAIQFGLQPFFVRWYCAEALTSVIVLGAEVCKIFVCTFILYWSGDLSLVYSSWTFNNSLRTAGIPAALYAIINVLYQIAYKNLDAVMFNFLNQTKLFWSAVFLWIFLKKPQSQEQIVALIMLTVSAVMLTISSDTKDTPGQPPKNSFIWGIIPVLTGSILSGIATTVSQKVLQNDNKNSYLYTSELAVWGIITLFVFMIFNNEKIIEQGIFKGWTRFTIIPVFTNALGGVFVGLVVKYAGGVRKGFGTVAGMFLTAVLSFFIEYSPLSITTWISLPLLIASVYIHTSYPYRPPSSPSPDIKKVVVDPPSPLETTPQQPEEPHDKT
jgi:UDP-sugar transporter A1/2/3